jgi:putative selenate reductase
MAELRPYPFGALIRRMFKELEQNKSIFDLPTRKFVLNTQKDVSVRFQDHVASTPLGPAAGPQSQMAQNIVLSWLGGSRIMELKTVQINDELDLPRPCIDMQTVGYNVEWSQELKLQQSLEEYVKGSMLIEILVASGRLEMDPKFARTIFDMSVGYDLAGIRSESVSAFIQGMRDASELIDRYRQEIPVEYKEFRDLDFTSKLSDTLTLSTFHGCPPEEVEGIMKYLLQELRLHSIVKLNPMLLGPKNCRQLLNEQMGYTDIHVPETAFQRDTKWDQAQGFVQRLGELASSLDLGFGVKFSNTLIVQNHRDFFPNTEKEMYLSGPPLHVLAINLVGQFRKTFEDKYPVSFSAGIDSKNFADAVAIGLVPITVCSDFLKPGGYARSQNYFKDLERRMKSVDASNVDEFILKAYGHATSALDQLGLERNDPEYIQAGAALNQNTCLADAVSKEVYARWVSRCTLLNTEHYVSTVTQDERYHQSKNLKLPKKIGSTLVLFDCITCDKCIPVCPNDANFSFVLPKGEITIEKLQKTSAGWTTKLGEALLLDQKHQIANFADFCNECGNCDVFCPEDGGPYIIKPRFFGSEQDWKLFSHLDGFYLERQGQTERILGRFDGKDFEALFEGELVQYRGRDFDVSLKLSSPQETIEGQATDVVDMTYLRIMRLIVDSVLASNSTSYPAMLQN